MNNMSNKPRLVFFQFRYEQRVPEFLLMHKKEHVKCLSQFFDVTVINEDCDYEVICDRYEPEIALFESGLQLRTAHRLNIKNTDKAPNIPKIGFFNADPGAHTRAGILSDMAQWGIETFFSICTTAAEHMPEISKQLFVWPNFVDAEIYRDYGESKIVPVLLTGCQNPEYHWRHKVYRTIAEAFPSLITPHHGYDSRSAAGKVMFGERYARAINATWFVPTCGTIAKEIVRKHFEIPACKACLVTEETPALKAAGFVDMKNCIFVDEKDVVERLAYLFEHSDELESIIEAGHRLVHSRHTIKNRDQIFQWYSLQKKLKANERIVQPGPFEPLVVVDASSERENEHVLSNGIYFALFRQAEDLLWAGKYEEAEQIYKKCSFYMGDIMAEPRLRIALCNLYKGNPSAALSSIIVPIQLTIAHYKATDPDPVEWAYFIICLLCQGRLKSAMRRAKQFPWLRHTELDRTRAVIHLLATGDSSEFCDGSEDQKSRQSIHQMPKRSVDEWLSQLHVMLRSCKQSTESAMVMKMIHHRYSFRPGSPIGSAQSERKDPDESKIGGIVFNEQSAANGNGKVTLCGLDNPLLLTRAPQRMIKATLRFLHRLEARFGYFLPYHLSEMKNDKFFKELVKLIRESTIKNVLIIGATSGKGSTEAFMEGALANLHEPSVICIGDVPGRFAKTWKIAANNSRVKWYEYSLGSKGIASGGLLERIKSENEIDKYDAVLVAFGNGVESSDIMRVMSNELRAAMLVVLENLSNSVNFTYYNMLKNNPDFVLTDYNFDLRSGYAIFSKAGIKRSTPGKVLEPIEK